MKNRLHFLEDLNIEQFQYDLLQWYKQNKRDLPWRQDQDPYKVLVSEIMLQQTQVDTVKPYFESFMETYPTIEDFAKAPQEDILKMWEGLGYYSRARNLHEAVKEVAASYGGKIPNNKKDISALKGVGPYTAGAVLSIAYEQPEPAVDGNVMRVMSRLLNIKDDIKKPKTRKVFESAVENVISQEDPSSFNQGLMELGALVCTPKSPSCLLCPVQAHCQAFHQGIQDELPVKSKKKAPKPITMAVAVLRNANGEVLIHRRPETGLLANMWEFPNHETDRQQDDDQMGQLVTFMKNEYGIDIQLTGHLFNFSHVFSHIKWNLAVYEGDIMSYVKETDTLKVVDREALTTYPFSVSHQKIIDHV